MKERTAKRECFLDILRIIACFLVIVNHTNSEIFLGEQQPSFLWFLSVTYFFLSKIAVPIFFMISGYLLLGKVDSWKKTGKRIFRMLVALMVCAVAYGAYRHFYLNPGASLEQLFKEMLSFYRASPSNALWYLYAYLGILLMLPFLQKMAKAMSKKDYWIFFAISGFFVGVLPILQHYFEWAEISGYFSLPLFGGYICMMLIGQYFARFGIKRSVLGFLLAALLGLLCLGFNVGATYLEFQRDAANYLFFDNRVFLPILLGSVCVFYMASFIRLPLKGAKIISYIGACTFGIYLISDMTISFTYPYILEPLRAQMNVFMAMILFELAVFLIGLAVTAPLKKIPLIRKFL